jgi:hypothetical protein
MADKISSQMIISDIIKIIEFMNSNVAFQFVNYMKQPVFFYLYGIIIIETIWYI